MPTIPSTEANRKFSTLLSNAQKGMATDITVRGKLVARLVPVTDAEASRQQEWQKHLDEIRNRPVMNLPRASRDEFYQR